MKIDVITIFPRMFRPILEESIIKRAQKKGLAEIVVHDLRDYSSDKHRKVDDRPFGGGPGMVFRPEPIFAAAEDIRRQNKGKISRVIVLSPQGKQFNQTVARRISAYKHVLFICGRYEGIDERVIAKLADEEISIGDYVLTGGELPAMVVIDAVVRLIPGVLGDKDSAAHDSFSAGLLEYPQYTRPAVFKGMKVPAILLSGDHQKIFEWRAKQTRTATKKKRPDLIS